MPSDEMVEKVARDAAKKMFFGLDPIDCHDDSDTYLVTFETAVKHIAAALAAAEAGVQPVASMPTTPSVAHGALWCQPGDVGKARVWMVFFEDPDKGRCVFGNEVEAREFWARATLSWNCYLFQAAPVDGIGSPPSEVSRDERAAIRKEAFEEAARIADSWNEQHQSSSFAHDAVRDIATAIRTRGET